MMNLTFDTRLEDQLMCVLQDNMNICVWLTKDMY